MIREPSILLLDEATSALDNESQKIVQQSLDDLMYYSKLTTVVIAHRLATIRDAHKIAVVSDGCVIEQGTHKELSASHGVYFRLLQAGDRDEAASA